MFQLWMTDEYGQGSIIASSNGVSDLIERARKEVNKDNVENPLTMTDKMKSWDSYFVDLYDEQEDEFVDETSGVYSGISSTGKPSVLLTEDGKMVPLTDVSASIRIYLGKINNDDWYATDGRGATIKEIKHQDLQGKSVYYIRKTR